MSLPPVAPARRAALTGELRDARAARRDPDAALTPVEGGEPMPAEELPPENSRGSGGPCR